jgi:hypothetical protein
VRLVLLALVLALPAFAGCMASSGPARETLIENVAPLPHGAPGVALHWGPADDPLLLAPGGCARIPWLLEAHDLARPAEIALELAATSGVEGRLVGQLTPNTARLSGNDRASGTVLVCAPENASLAHGAVSLVASAGNQTIGLSSVRVDVHPSG